MVQGPQVPAVRGRGRVDPFHAADLDGWPVGNLVTGRKNAVCVGPSMRGSEAPIT